MTKKVETTLDYFVKFTDEEASQLGINQGDKFSVKKTDEGILLEKWKSLEIDLDELSIYTLRWLITESTEKDISVNEVFNQVLLNVIEQLDDKQYDKTKGSTATQKVP